MGLHLISIEVLLLYVYGAPFDRATWIQKNGLECSELYRKKAERVNQNLCPIYFYHSRYDAD